MNKVKVNYKQALLAVVLTAATIFISLYIVMPKEKKVQTDSSGIKLGVQIDDPQVATSTFIYLAGNMKSQDDYNSDRFIFSLTNRDEASFNSIYRLNSLEKARGLLSPGSLITVNTEIARGYGQSITIPEQYTVLESSIKVSNPTDNRKITINSGEYNAVNITANFISQKDTFDHPRDSTWDGLSYTHYQNNAEITLNFTLVEVDGFWYVYNIDDVNTIMGPRFSTWSTQTAYELYTETDREIGIVK